MEILNEPAIILISLCFLFCMFSTLRNYINVNKNLNGIYLFLSKFDKKELSYRFEELDGYMSQNPYTATIWEDFKKALIFPEKIFKTSNLSNGDYKSEIYLTIDADYFFNEETLIQSKINYKFIQIMPTLLTGLGPFFTFLKMAMAFTAITLTTSEQTTTSLDLLLSNIHVAALCSVFAVGYSLIFMFIEKVLYNKKCKKYYLLIQKEFTRLFDIVTSERFLMSLVKETKLQNIATEKMLKTIPENMQNAFTKSLSETMSPYLENILYSLNKLNNSLGNGSGGDIVDKLF